MIPIDEVHVLDDGRQFLTTEGLTATLVQVLPREQPLIRKQTLGILLLLAEDGTNYISITCLFNS